MKTIVKAAAVIIIALQPLLFASGKKDAADVAGSANTAKQFQPAAYKQRIPEGLPIDFNETWGYVMEKRESELDFNYPVTDVGHFSAEVNCYGELDGIPDRQILRGYSGRVHLVIICDSRSLTHFVLDPQFKIRQKLVQQIIEAARPFDGIQIDFELIPGRDGRNFIDFLKEVKKGAESEGKIFSVCVPARVKTISNDVFPYKEIAEISDRVIVMAYDEHWSTSAPGPIASMDWSQKIVNYASTVIPQEKLVMGLPFYGRTWADKKTANGWYFSGMNRIMRENKIKKVEYIEDIPTASINMNVTLTGWFEDSHSLVQKMRMYKTAGVKSVAFWRIGQEDPSFWQWITVSSRITAAPEQK